jgi:benzodiazapine receptor
MTTYIPSLTLPSFVFEKAPVSILLPVISGVAIGSTVSPDRSKKVYTSLKQPPGHPPAWLFGPVWTVLYATMGYTAYRAWNTGTLSLSMDDYHLAKVCI